MNRRLLRVSVDAFMEMPDHYMDETMQGAILELIDEGGRTSYRIGVYSVEDIDDEPSDPTENMTSPHPAQRSSRGAPSAGSNARK